MQFVSKDLSKKGQVAAVRRKASARVSSISLFLDQLHYGDLHRVRSLPKGFCPTNSLDLYLSIMPHNAYTVIIFSSMQWQSSKCRDGLLVELISEISTPVYNFKDIGLPQWSPNYGPRAGSGPRGDFLRPASCCPKH